MQNQNRKIIFTTISIDKDASCLVEKKCKRYSLKKSEAIKLAFQYLDKANINPSEAPESTKAELRKINKRQDDLIRFIRRYEEEQFNPMIRTSSSIATRFDTIVKCKYNTLHYLFFSIAMYLFHGLSTTHSTGNKRFGRSEAMLCYFGIVFY